MVLLDDWLVVWQEKFLFLILHMGNVVLMVLTFKDNPKQMKDVKVISEF
jgi:hypothetical protein